MSTPLSHAHLHPIAPEDDLTFPSLTTSASPNDAFQQSTPSGLVSAKEAEADLPLSHASSRTQVGVDVEKGLSKDGEEPDGKLVTWKGEDDPENPRNFSILRKW